MIDIVVPTYARSSILPQALKTVQDQVFQNWHCWIAEDGATTETREAVRPFLSDDRFSYIPGIHAGTPAIPRNRALLQGSAPYVSFLDDDDLWLPEKLEKQFEFMESHPDCVLLGCNAFLWSGKDSWNASLPLYFTKAPFGRIYYKALVRDNYLVNSTVLLRRSVLKRAGLLNETMLPAIGEDYEWWLRIGACGEIWLMPEPLVTYRVSLSSSIGSSLKGDRRRNYEIKARIYSFALKGAGATPSPLSRPEYAHYAALCRYERDFYEAGPRFGGRILFAIRSVLRRTFFPTAGLSGLLMEFISM